MTISSEELERLGRNSLEQVESRLAQLHNLQKVSRSGNSWSPPVWAAHLDHTDKLAYMAEIYRELRDIMRKRLGIPAAMVLAMLAGCGQAVRTQVAVTYTDGPCAVTVQTWR